ncbi:MAG: acetyl-CoA C-acyltransferase [Candidatus Eisenbacteria bacterium]
MDHRFAGSRRSGQQPDPNPRTEADPDPIVLLAARRTPVGRFLGSLASQDAPSLGAVAVRAVLADTPTPAPPDLLVFGCARPAGVGPNPARQVAHRAGLPNETIAWTVNMACASGLEAIASAARALRTGEATWAVAGGMESMSRVPYLLDRARSGYRLGHAPLVDGMYRDGFLCPISEMVMGETAELLARRYSIPREEQDAFALESQRRHARARAEGAFAVEIAPVEDPSGKAGRVANDEHPRPETTAEDLARLRPVFERDGTVTAGNASGISDGAAAVLLARASSAREAGLAPRARILGWQASGVDPAQMGIGPVPAVRALLSRLGLSLADFDRIELNEAFAAQALAVDRELRFDRGRLNVAGGAIALGHPIGCSGARIVVTLLHALERCDGRLGLATLCASGGFGLALAIERIPNGES